MRTAMCRPLPGDVYANDSPAGGASLALARPYLDGRVLMRPPPRLAVLFAALPAMLLALLLALPLRDAAAAEAQGVTAAAPIAVQDILVRADEEQQRLESAKALLALPAPDQRLRAMLDAIAVPVQATLRATPGVALHDLPIMRLESLARHWQFDALRFAQWEVQARRAFAPYADSAMQLAQQRAAWSATRAAGLLDGLPPVLSQRVDAMMTQIEATETALAVVLARQFELTQRSSELKAQIQSGRDAVAAAISDIDQRLLRLDMPALWHGSAAGAPSETMLANLFRGLEIERQFAIDYNAAATGKQQAVRVVQLLLLPLIAWLALRSRQLRHAGNVGNVASTASGELALRRPFSTWILLSMLAVLMLEPDAPLLVEEFALLLALVPVLRLLPGDTTRALGAWPYVAIALYLLDRLGLAAVVDTGLYRLFLLALNMLALGLTVRLLRHAITPDAGARGQRLQALVRPLAWVVLLALAVAAVCNIAGNVSMAETLTSGIIDSGYMALLLYASVTACLGLLRALLGQPELARQGLVRRHGALLQAACTRLVAIAAAAAWLVYTLHRFRILRPLQETGATILGIGIEVGEVALDIGDILVFLFSSWLAFWAARAVRRILREELPGHSRLPRGVGNSIASLSYYGVLLAGLLIALSAAGFKVSQLTLVFGALGVGIGFGLQNVVNNFVSGLVLMFERPVQPGDIIDAAGTSGTVRQIGLRATIIRTFDGADTVVPNGALLSGNLSNWTMFDRHRRFEITLGVAYGSDPARVLDVLRQAAAATPGIEQEPAPVILLTGFGDSALNFAVRAWTTDVATWQQVRGDLLSRTLAVLAAAGIGIPYQRIDVNIRPAPAE